MKKIYVKVILLIFLLFHVVSCDEAAQKTKLKACFGKEMDKENLGAPADLKLNDSQLYKMKRIVYYEIDKEPLKKHTPEEQKKCYKDMEDAAKTSIPEVKQEAIDKILHKVHDMSMHCVKELAN